VRLRWEPPRAGRVRIARRRRGSSAPALLREDAPGRLDDGDLVVGGRYRYGVVVEYGDGVESPEAALTVTADVDPEPQELQVAVDHARALAVASWSGTPNGALEILDSPERPALAPGEVVAAAELPAGPRHAVAPDAGQLALPLTGGRRYLTPVVVRGGWAAVGTPRLVASQAPVAGLSLRRFQREVLARWEWPAGCAAAEVQAEPALALTVTRAQYERDGGCWIPIGDETDRVTVTAIGLLDGEAVRSAAVSAALAVGRGGAIVRYEVVRDPAGRGLRRRRPAAVVRVEATGVVDPLVVVVVLRPGRTRPLELADPRCVRVLELVVDTATETAPIERPVELGTFSRPFYLRAFAADATTRVVDPPRDQLVFE
jgi:hypothetical protein